jgi:STE24 endopeptidase
VSTERPPSERASERASQRLCLGLVAGSGLVLVVLAAWLVPWSWVPGGHLVDVPSDEVFSAAQLRRSETYAAMQRHLGWASLAVSLVVALALGLTPVGARIARRVRGPWWVRALVTTLVILLIGVLVTAPFALVARSNALEYGLTNQSLTGWLRDRGVSLLVSWVFSGVLVLLVIGTARLSPRRWPLWTALAGVVLTLAGSWVYPVLVEPLFNQFSSLPQGELRTGVLELARKEKVPVSDVLVADASRRTTTLNAYVSGFGSTRRVVLYDNLVDDVPQREALVVVAHELGHARNHDVLLGTVLGAVGVGVGSGLLGLLLSRRRLLERADVESPGQPEVVALLLALVAVGSLLASPFENTVSRAIEARADRASLVATGDYDGFETVQAQLAERSLSDDDPPWLSQFWFGSHPTTLQRIGLARALEQRR